MTVSRVRGAQRHVMACVKHFACNSIENSRFKVDVQIDDADLRDLYLPHFKRCVDAGAAFKESRAWYWRPRRPRVLGSAPIHRRQRG